MAEKVKASVYDDSGFNPHPGHVVASLDKTFYDDWLSLNKQQIQWTKTICLVYRYNLSSNNVEIKLYLGLQPHIQNKHKTLDLVSYVPSIFQRSQFSTNKAKCIMLIFTRSSLFGILASLWAKSMSNYIIRAILYVYLSYSLLATYLNAKKYDESNVFFS